MLSGGFGDDVTDVNESPLRSGRDEIHRVPVEIPCLAPPEPPVYPAQPCLESRRCIAQGAWGQHLLKCLIQISCPPPCSTGIPGGADSSCVAPSFSSSGLSFCPFMLPLHSGGDIFVSLHHTTLSQVICFSSGFYHCCLQPFHILFSAELARQWHADFSLILEEKKENDGGGEERERTELE